MDLDSVSPRSEGQADDGLPPRTDELSAVPRPEGRPEPVRMVRVEDNDGARWVFSRGTVARIEVWHAALDDRWIHDAVVVRFKEFAASSLDIEVIAWFQTPAWSEFQLIRRCRRADHLIGPVVKV